MNAEAVKQGIVGAAHIGVTVSDIEKSIAFYKDVLFMELVHQNTLDDDAGVIKLAFLQKGDLVIELYQMPVWDSTRGDGVIDHIAFKVDDIEKVSEALKANGIEFEQKEIVFGDIMDNGARWILFRGPDGEHLELNQVL